MGHSSPPQRRRQTGKQQEACEPLRRANAAPDRVHTALEDPPGLHNRLRGRRRRQDSLRDVRRRHPERARPALRQTEEHAARGEQAGGRPAQSRRGRGANKAAQGQDHVGRARVRPVGQPGGRAAELLPRQVGHEASVRKSGGDTQHIHAWKMGGHIGPLPGPSLVDRRTPEDRRRHGPDGELGRASQGGAIATQPVAGRAGGTRRLPRRGIGVGRWTGLCRIAESRREHSAVGRFVPKGRRRGHGR
mmetsp:Transcript_90/g.179  ORF Transcript_90/g.179 Transcript_90/m.179 type:complete len:247 (+) Transcript_90:673-1413(+)